MQLFLKHCTYQRKGSTKTIKVKTRSTRSKVRFNYNFAKSHNAKQRTYTPESKTVKQDQSNLWKGGIALASHSTLFLYCLGGSKKLIVWSQFATGGLNLNLWALFLKSQHPTCNTMYHLTLYTCQVACNSVERFKKDAQIWQTTDRRQTTQRTAAEKQANRLRYNSDFA